jgi:hypothetical protein
MRSPAARAFAWEFGQQHRWGVQLLAIYVLFMVITGVLGIDWALTSDASVARFIGTIVLPLTAAVLYLLAVFSFGLSGDLAARQSMYPPRLFTLPVTTAALAGWPMFYGAVAMVVLAQATRLASWPSETELEQPPFWLLLFAPVILAWTQVVMWMSYPVRGLRVVAAVVTLIAIDMIAIVAIELKPRESVMAAVLMPLLLVAWVVAYAAVARARRGDVPDWRNTFAPLASLAQLLPRREQFASPLSAQTWYEWRQYGWSLPVLVAFVLPFALGLLFLDRTAPAFVIISLAVVALTPPIMASFVASTVRKASPGGNDYGLAPFLATRPLTSAALIAAKLRVSILSTLITWLLVIAAVPLALSLSETWPIVIERARDLRDLIGLPRAVVVAVLAVLALVTTTWKRLVTSLYIGLSGRPWLVRTHIGVTLVLLVVAIPLAQWIGRNTLEIVIRIFDVVPQVAAVLVAVKIAAAGWIATRLDRARLIEPRVLVTAATLWLTAVLSLYAVLGWMADTPHIPRHGVLLVAILAIPLTRLSAAPLALASNRHR